MDQNGFRGSAIARIDDKGRLKVPTSFRGGIQDLSGPDVFVTSLTGGSVLLYPMQVWLDIERKLAAAPSNHPSVQKFMDRVNYYGQTSELDGQGRVVVPQLLRESAAIVGDVRVFGRIRYLEVWNEERFAAKLQRDAWTDEDGMSLAQFGI